MKLSEIVHRVNKVKEFEDDLLRTLWKVSDEDNKAMDNK